MHVLVIADDHYHPSVTVRGGLAPLEAAGYTFDWIEDCAGWSSDVLSGYPLVILAKSDSVSRTDNTSWVTPDVEQAFADYVRGGGGLLALHAGTVYGKTGVLRPLLGGTFVQHPAQLDVTVEPAAGHPLTAGVSTFTTMDEHYHMAMEEGVTDIFMTTSSEHGTQPGGWTRTEGAGRVGVLTPGHNLEGWLEPSYQKLLDNVMRWCANADAV